MVNEVFPFSEFSQSGDSSFSHPCRCGGVFEVCLVWRVYWQIFQEEVDQGMDLVECSECSLVCRIEY